MSDKKLKVKKLLKRELSIKSEYTTTYKDIKKYFKMLNDAVFDGKLSPFNEIIIKQIRDRKKYC